MLDSEYWYHRNYDGAQSTDVNTEKSFYKKIQANM